MVLRHPSFWGVWWGYRDPSVIAALPTDIKGLTAAGGSGFDICNRPIRRILPGAARTATSWRGDGSHSGKPSRSRGTICPGLAISSALSCEEGAGKAGCRRHPHHRVREVLQKVHTGLTGTAETSRLSPRNGVTAYTRSPRGTACFAPVAPPAQAGGDRRQGRGARTTRFRRTPRTFRRVALSEHDPSGIMLPT